MKNGQTFIKLKKNGGAFILRVTLKCTLIAHSASVYGLSAGWECLPVMWGFSPECGKQFLMSGVVTHVCNPSTQEPGTGGLLAVKGQPGLVVQTFLIPVLERSRGIQVFLFEVGQPGLHSEPRTARVTQWDLVSNDKAKQIVYQAELPQKTIVKGSFFSVETSKQYRGRAAEGQRLCEGELGCRGVLLQFTQQRTKAFVRQHQI